MIRTATSAVWLCLLASLALPGQQEAPTPAPATPAAGNAQTQPTGDASATIDPKTNLPYTPEELREMEIDKYDPMKRDSDAAVPSAAPKQKNATPPLPGSIAAMNADQAEAQDPGADSAAANGAEYTGPAVLSRSYTLARPMLPRQIQWNATAGFNAGRTLGQAPSATNGQTSYQEVSTDTFGYSWGLSGRHIWRRDQVGLAYSGSFSTYGRSGMDGFNHSVNLDYSHILTQRISVQAVESVQDLSQNYSLENPTLQPGDSIANINLATSPQIQLLNSVTRQSSTSVSMTYRQTARLSYNLSDSYFIIGRTEGVGMRGSQYGADVNYRLTRKTTVGSYYSFTDYSYSHNIANSTSNGAGLIFSYAFNGTTQLQTRVGVTRLENLAYSSVPLPPALAQILGQSSVVINAYSLRNTSDISAQLVRDFRRSRTASLSYVHGQSPGNGVLLTSEQQTISGGFSTSLFRRRYPVSVGMSYSTISSTSPASLGFYKSEVVYASASRALGRNLSANVRFNYIRYDISDTPLIQHSIQISTGLSWTAPESLLRKL